MSDQSPQHADRNPSWKLKAQLLRISNHSDIGAIDLVEREVSIRFDNRLVSYDFSELDEVSLAYAVTIHKSQGSEFPAVVMPIAPSTM